MKRQGLHDQDYAHKDPQGLTILHEPEGATLADVVFVHSLGGGSFRSWSDDGRPGTFWPRDWLTREDLVRSARISTYGYSSQVMASDPDRVLDFTDTAKDLLARLRFSHDGEGRALDVGRVPLIFVAHSLGGMIAKKAYLLAMSDPNSTYGDIAESTAAFVFFSTPHRSLNKNTLNDILSACMPGWRFALSGDPAKRSALRLQDVNEKFRDLASPLDIYSFYTRPAAETDYGSFALPPELTTLEHPSETQIPLNADHSVMTRYSSRNDPNYATVRGVLRVLIEKFKSRRKSPAPEDVAIQTAKVHQLLKGCEAPQDDLSFFSDRRNDGSCQWVLEDPVMESFLADEGTSPKVLWCFGGPGSGKSVTATYLIEHLLWESRPCAYYYFRSGNQDKNNLGQFMTSLAAQISHQIPEYRRKLTALAANRFDVGKAGHKLLWKELFVIALLQCSPKEPLYIVIDGLDELAQSKELLQRMLVDLADSRIHLRVLFVSRPTLEIETSVERVAKRMHVQKMALDCHKADLALYVRDEMDVMMGDDDFKEKVVKQVLAKAGQNFLWVHLVVQEILHCQTEIQVESALQQVPKELEPLYERMDKRIAELLRSRPQDHAMSHTIVKWAACSRRPLQLDEIKAALEYDFPRIMDMRQTIQRLCGEFVHVDKKGRVSMMHASAREFLLSNARLNYHINIHEASHTLFSRCMQALSASRRGHGRLEEQEGGFLLYAASSWPFHLSQSSDFGDHIALSATLRLLSNHAVLDWIFMLASAGNLRVVVEASKALSKFVKTVDRADRERSPLMHRLDDKDTINVWSQDLIRVVGRFGPQMARQPKTVYDLMPAFCPKGSMLYKQFGLKRGTKDDSHLSVRGRHNLAWDDCFAKFSIPGDALPRSIVSLDRYFAILTKDDGIVHLYYSSTCEMARQFQHGGIVLAWCVDSARIATYGFRKTTVWEIESGRLLVCIDNSRSTKALAISFQRSLRGEDMLFTLSDDRVVRSCSLESMRAEWEEYGTSLDDDLVKTHQINSPHNALFSADGLYLAISYRGANPLVWYLGSSLPRFIAHCDHRGRRSSNHIFQHTRNAYVVDFAWNSLTGHLMGAYIDGLIFRWHPVEDDFLLSQSEFKSQIIKCSADGKLFVTGSGSGVLRVWDFEHFTPIYEMRYPVRLTDLDLGWNEARIYDVREHHCNIWEPGSLLRALESDDVLSDTHSSKDSERPSLASDAQGDQGEFEPVTACAATGQSAVYAKGNDAGQVTVSTFDGEVLLELEDSYESIEQLAWSADGSVLADVNLGREIKVHKIEVAADKQRPTGNSETLRSFSEKDEILQILFNASGQRLMLTTPLHVKVHDISANTQPTVVPDVHPSQWMTHPLDEEFALGFGPGQVVMSPWNDLTNRTTLAYEEVDNAASNHVRSSMRFPNPRRPSQAYPASPSEIDQTVSKILASPSSTLVLIEVIGATKQRRRRSQCLLMDTKHLDPGGTVRTLPVCSIPSKLVESLYVSLGFIDPASFTSMRALSALEHRRSVSPRQLDLSTFAFVSTDFWVCSADIGIGQREEDLEIKRHFFLPRDWQNAEWLEMAKVTPAGDFLCPRNGDVAVVSNGFSEEFRL